jgi:hypothetical protein
MPRRKLVKPTKSVTFRLDEELVAFFELLLLDPVANRSSYGKKSLIVEQLLQRFIDAARNTQEDPVTMDVTDLANIILQR